MKCEMCSKHSAIIQIQQVVNNKKRSIRLCKHCAKTLGIISGKAGDKSRFTIPNLFSKMFEGITHERAEKKCKACGTSIASIESEQKAGCTECYAVFNSQIKRIVNSLFGNVRHLGKYPMRFLKYKQFITDILGLKKLLAQAVKEEDYEHAAVLRDRIKSMRDSEW